LLIARKAEVFARCKARKEECQATNVGQHARLAGNVIAAAASWTGNVLWKAGWHEGPQANRDCSPQYAHEQAILNMGANT
jgi:hypothetical protein